MTVAGGPCPNCGSPIQFLNGSSMTRTCDHCGNFVVRTDRGLQNIGRVADLAATEHGLIVGDQGNLGGRPFQVIGVLLLRHPQGGTWEEYYVRHEDGSWSWISTAQGRWFALAPTSERTTRHFDAIQVGTPVQLGGYGHFVVSEKNTGVFETARGELPDVVAPGQHLRFIDLSGPNGHCGSIHYVREGGLHQVFIGREITRTELNLVARTGVAPGAAPGSSVGTAQLRCNNCGGDLPARVDKNAARIVCPYCKAVTDLELHQVIARQDAARAAPLIPLGTRANLYNVDWVVIGCVERSASIEGEHFGWSEYLLYNDPVGYRWLIADEGVWRFAVPVSAGDIDPRSLPRAVGFQGKTFIVRNQNAARVDRVLGEFYWKVEVGETVQATDFVAGDEVLSREANNNEVQWTIAKAMPTGPLFRALGLPMPTASNLNFPGVAAPTTAQSNSTTVIVIIVLAFVCLLCVCISLGDNDSGGSSGGYYGGHGGSGWSGGFGGK